MIRAPVFLLLFASLFTAASQAAVYELPTDGSSVVGADAGFVTTFATGPNDRSASFDANKQTHRTIALTSIALATGSYLIMLFGNR